MAGGEQLQKSMLSPGPGQSGSDSIHSYGLQTAALL